jgi:hypothetical protein
MEPLPKTYPLHQLPLLKNGASRDSHDDQDWNAVEQG